MHCHEELLETSLYICRSLHQCDLCIFVHKLTNFLCSVKGNVF